MREPSAPQTELPAMRGARVDTDVTVKTRPTRKHQVKVSLRRADAKEISLLARQEGEGTGTLIRRLALKHLAALAKPAGAKLRPPAREADKVKLGNHLSVWFTDEDYALLRRVSAIAGVTVSGYLGRTVLEPWLLGRRAAIAKAPAPAQPQRP